ncbi:hypothetical protein HNR34_002233 [Geobacillus subterraneus]
MLAALLEGIDQQLAEARGKRRYQLKDKRPITRQTLFGDVVFRRSDYYDRQAGAYTFLLDDELGLDGARSISPCLEETAIELAVECSSYRKAARTRESIVGDAVLSHEAIRQLVLEAPVSLHPPCFPTAWPGAVCGGGRALFPARGKGDGRKRKNPGGSRGMETKRFAARARKPALLPP